MKAFSKEEIQRYSRHLLMPDFNIEGQKKLRNATILVVGAGGLGSPALLYLAAAGTGSIIVVDDDLVSLDNLQRQVLYGTSDIGKSKAACAKTKLEQLNPHCHVQCIDARLSSGNALDLLAHCDVVVDASDNFPTRYLVNDACVILRKPLVYGSVFRFEGQLSVFNFIDANGVTGPNYRDLFPHPPAPHLAPDCAESGVIGALPGIIGSMQAIEAIKVATGVGNPLAGRLHIVDAFSFESRTITFKKHPDTPEITQLEDYDAFCGLDRGSTPIDVPEYTAQQLHQALASDRDQLQLIDVREQYEYDIAHLDARLIPLRELEARMDEIDQSKRTIVYCRSGMRSATAVRTLREKHGFDHVYNLKGGLLAWAGSVDGNMPVY